MTHKESKRLKKSNIKAVPPKNSLFRRKNAGKRCKDEKKKNLRRTQRQTHKFTYVLNSSTTTL